MRRLFAVLIPCCFGILLFAPQPAGADPLEQVVTHATGVLPADVTVTVNDPSAATHLVRGCITIREANNRQICVAV